MKSSAPWSVKGIKRDARETAKEAARRHGMTVGEWLSQVIYAAGDPESSDGEIEGIKTSDIVTAIEHLNKRVISAESKSAAAIEDLARNIGGVVERLQRVERTRPASGAPSLEERLRRLESRTGDSQRIDALKALEKAVTQVALQYDSAHKSTATRLDATERQLQELASRFDHAADAAPAASQSLAETIRDLSQRVEQAERAAAEANRIKTETVETVDAEFVERTGARLRILGDEIKRSGDQIRTLESLIKKLSDQIDAAERRSSEGVQKVAETITELRTQFGDAGESGGGRQEIEAAIAEVTERTESRISELQRSFESMIARIEAPSSGGDDAPAAAVETDDRDDSAPGAAQAGAEVSGVSPESDPDTPFEADLDAIFGGLAGEERVEEEAEGEDEDAFSFDRDEPSEGETATEAGFGGETGADDDRHAPEASEGESWDKNEPESDESRVREAFEPSPGQAELDDPLSAILADSDEQAGEQSGDRTKENAGGAAAESAAARSAELQARRRQLTPKQRALLAAKIRRKRLAEKGLAVAEKSDAPQPPPVVAESRPHSEEEDLPRPSIMSQAASAISGWRARLPGGRRPEDADLEETPQRRDAVEDSDETADSPPNLTRAARNALSRTGVKPVTVALAAAIVLATAALAFLVKDLISGDASDRVGAVSASNEDSTPDETAPAASDKHQQSQPETTVPAAPEAPTTQPRALYLDAVAKLEAAKTDAQTQAALKLLQQAAALGHPPAQLQLGELYKLGQGVKQDMAQARVWYQRAAEGGNVLAMHRVGVMAARGQGGPVDIDEAIAWFEKAANFGLVDSQYNLGATYHPASGGASSSVQDAGKAYYWYSLAARNGDEQAKKLAAGLAGSLSPEERSAIDQRVAEWKAQTPDPDANEVSPAS